MSSKALNIVITGAGGRMGRMLIQAIVNAPDLDLVGAVDREESEYIATDAGEFFGKKIGVIITPDINQVLPNAHVLIDFTRPQACLEHLQACAQHGVKVVIGTTGFDAAGKATIARFSEENAVVFSPNMSVGVNVTLKLLELAAQSLRKGYDIEIIEAHHRHKVDAPSGTALKMGEVIAEALGQDLRDCAVYERHNSNHAREANTIGFSAIRGGDIVGDHTVLFAGEGERIEISHKSSSRESYAQGSLFAARFLANQESGLYDMFDVLGLRTST